MVSLKLAPCSTSQKMTPEARNESSTEKIVTLCAPWRVMKRPPRPATRAPISGAKAAMRARSFIPALELSSFQLVEVFDVDGVQVAEQDNENRQPDGRLGGGHGEDEEHEHLPGDVAEEVREGDEVQVDRQQHQLDRHQQHDQVAAVEEDADHADREEDRAQHEVVRDLERHSCLCAPIPSPPAW